MSGLLTTDFVLPRNVAEGGLEVTLTRYTQPATRTFNSFQNTISLLFLHGVSYHKEMWIPTIEHIFANQAVAARKPFIVEAWTMDAPHHGQAAIRNERKLLARPEGLTAYDVAQSVKAFHKSGLAAGASLVGIAHSASTSVISLSTLGYPIDGLPYSSIILVDPPTMTREVFARVTQDGKAWNLLVNNAKTRQDIWPSRAAARAWMETRPPWNTWRPRCIDLFVEYALRDLPTASYPDHPTGVTLCCTREQEASGYSYPEDGFDCLDRLKDVVAAIPVHGIFGEKHDLVPKFIRTAFLRNTQEREAMASIRNVRGAGHLVVAEDPERLATSIWDALVQNTDATGVVVNSKL